MPPQTSDSCLVATDSADPIHKLFYYNISTLFYNLYKIVDTVPSPKRGVEFDPTQLEVLEAIRNLSFGGPTCPVGLRYLQETSALLKSYCSDIRSCETAGR
jgi:hypothetical protein